MPMPADATNIARDQIVEAVCERIIAGESIAAIFRAPGSEFPSYATFWRWVAADESLRKLVTDAENAACNALADRIVDVARECREGTITTQSDKDGKSVKTVDMVERSKLEVHALQWVLARRLPKRFGDRTILAGDADNPVAIDDPKAILARRLAPKPSGPGEGGSDSGTE